MNIKAVIFAFTTLILTLTLFVACGENTAPIDGTDSTVPAPEKTTVPTTTTAPEPEPIPLTETLNFGGLHGLGNDPNNLYQSDYGLAFDDSYIYWGSNGSGRVKYDGTGYESLPLTGSHLNVYDGYLYSCTNKTGSKLCTATVMRMNLSTHETEEFWIYNGHANYNECYFSSMLVRDGYIFLAVCDTNDGGTDRTDILALDIATRNTYTLDSCIGEHQVDFFCDDSRLFALREQSTGSSSRTLLGIPMAEVGSSAMTEASFTCNFPYYHTVMFGTTGYLACTESVTAKSYADLDLQGSSWSYTDCDLEIGDSPLSSLYDSSSQRFIVGNSMIVLATDYRRVDASLLGDYKTDTAVYFCHDMDFANAEEIGRIQNVDLFINNRDNRFGVHNNTFYVVEETDDGCNLITVTADGTFTKTVLE